MAYIEVDVDIDEHIDELSDRALEREYLNRGLGREIPSTLTLYEQETLDLVINKLQLINHDEIQEFLKKY